MVAVVSSALAQGQVNIDIGATSGSASVPLTSASSFTYNFGVTASAGTLTMTQVRVAIARGQNTTAPVTIEIFSGLGGTGTLLRTVNIPASVVSNGNMLFTDLPLGAGLPLAQGAYSVKISTTASGNNADYSMRSGVLTLSGSDSVTLNTSQWIQDNNTTGTAGSTLAPSAGYVLADHTVSSSTVNLGRFHTGGSGSTSSVSYNNVAPATTGNVTESLTVSSITTGSAVVTNVPATYTVQGGSNNVTLGVTNAAGAQSGTVQLNFNSTQTGSNSTRTGTAQSVGSRTITVSGTGYTGKSEWTANQSGSWGNNTDDFARWESLGGTPGIDGAASVADTALFGSAATAARTITLDDAAPQLKELTFNNASNGYTIAQGSGNNALGLGNATNAGLLRNQAGNHTISAGVSLGNDLTYNGSANTTTTISGDIFDNGNNYGLTKQGTGTLRIQGINSYGGATSVQAGTLIMNGTTYSATSVSSGATLGGSGTFNNTTTIDGIHSPGNSPGTQTFNEGLTYNSGASVLWELIANSTADRGTNYDAIDVNGGLNFAGATTLNLNFNFSGSPTSSTVNWANSFWDTDKTGTDGWEIFRATEGSISGFENLTLGGPLLDASGNALSNQRGVFSLYNSGGSIYLNYTATVIPEASTSLLGILGAAVMLRRRRIS